MPAIRTTENISLRRASLEIVKDDNSIKCWGRDGRFMGKFWRGAAEDEYVFITIPLDEEKLRPYLRQDEESDGLGRPYKTRDWHHEYICDDPCGFGWHIAITDMVSYFNR